MFVLTRTRNPRLRMNKSVNLQAVEISAGQAKIGIPSQK